ncbi:MAG: large subunit ribosomal protein L23 [Granulosicoccus sp.]|jgi:large subunit ribosomal protein L23
MNDQRLYQILLAPHVSEKTATAAEMEGRHTFRVAPDATKLEVRKAVEKLFDVTVRGVQMVNVPGKSKRFGSKQGKRSDWKKAIVRLAEGQDIDFMGIEG